MDIVEKLEFLVGYYRSNRAVGHTTAMLRGVQNMDDVMVLFPTRRLGEVHTKKLSTRPELITWMDLGNESLYGLCLPLVMDHSALEVMFKEIIREITELRKLNTELVQELDLRAVENMENGSGEKT